MLSVGRILIANPHAMSTLVWAEDGLFPLCTRAHGLWPCLVEPYSGYLLLVPRLVASPVGAFPLDLWPLVTNIAAALLAGALAAVTVVVLRRGGVGAVASALVAIVPVVAPIAGFEAINVTASIYMPLLFLATLAVCFPDPDRFPTTAYAIGAVLVALTIPSSAVLLVVLLVQTMRRRIPRRSAAIVGGVMALALAVQLWAAASAEVQRPLAWSLDALRSWLDGVPVALLSFVPDQVVIAPSGALAAPILAEVGAIGVAFVVVMLAIGIGLGVLRERTLSGIGLAITTGLLLGALPAAAGYANNRYFVIPVLILLATLIIGIDRFVSRGRSWVMVVVGALLIAVCVPSLEASPTRATAVPEWGPMLDAARAQCQGQPDGVVALTFSPSWPFADARFPGVTGNVVGCEVVQQAP